MLSLRILYDLKSEIQHTAMDIRIANNYDDACAEWKAAHDHLLALQESGILSDAGYQVLSNMLNQAIAN